MRRLILAAMAVTFLAVPLAAQAHPLGNFTINHHLAITVSDTGLEIGYVIDMAEIPAFSEISGLDEDGDGVASISELDAHSGPRCDQLRDGLDLRLDGRGLVLTTTESSMITQPGQNGVPTVRIECGYHTRSRSGELTIEDGNFPERIGWAEIVVSSEDLPIETDLATESQSAYLTSYPRGALDETPDVRSGSVTIGRGSTVAGAAAPVVALGSAFDTSDLGFLAGLVAIGAALLLGAGHALAPGHGKTIVAAYLVGTKGTPRQALVLAGATAVSHTAGVAILGVIAAGASVVFEPTIFYPYLSTLAGLVVLGVGGRLLWLALARKGHGHSHGSDDHSHEHGSPGHHREDESEPSLGWKAVAALGLSGGLVPSASAVVLLLGAIQLGRAWFGVILVAAFGVGMASALVASGLLAVAAHRFGWRMFAGRRPESILWRWVPITAASAVVVVGVVLTVSALGDLPIL